MAEACVDNCCIEEDQDNTWIPPSSKLNSSKNEDQTEKKEDGILYWQPFQVTTGLERHFYKYLQRTEACVDSCCIEEDQDSTDSTWIPPSPKTTFNSLDSFDFNIIQADKWTPPKEAEEQALLEQVKTKCDNLQKETLQLQALLKGERDKFKRSMVVIDKLFKELKILNDVLDDIEKESRFKIDVAMYEQINRWKESLGS